MNEASHKSANPQRAKRHRKSRAQWGVLIVDGTILDVCPWRKARRRYSRLTRLKGIEVRMATNDEREIFLARKNKPSQ